MVGIRGYSGYRGCRYTGYGGPINVIRTTVKELENAGFQGRILEDQLWPKRCGHMVGEKVIPLVANMVEEGLSPILTLTEFEELGYQFVGFCALRHFCGSQGYSQCVDGR